MKREGQTFEVPKELETKTQHDSPREARVAIRGELRDENLSDGDPEQDPEGRNQKALPPRREHVVDEEAENHREREAGDRADGEEKEQERQRAPVRGEASEQPA